MPLIININMLIICKLMIMIGSLYMVAKCIKTIITERNNIKINREYISYYQENDEIYSHHIYQLEKEIAESRIWIRFVVFIMIVCITIFLNTLGVIYFNFVTPVYTL